MEKLLEVLQAEAEDEGLTLDTSAPESLYGGQFTLSTQLIKPNYLVILLPTQNQRFFRNLPPYIATLLGATCCTRLATLLRHVATCWVLLRQIRGFCMILWSFGQAHAMFNVAREQAH